MTGIRVKYSDFLDGVAIEPNGPKIVSRWGFKKIDIAGETVLLALTESEIRDEMHASGLTDDEISAKLEEGRSDCRSGGLSCYPDQCRDCRLVNYASGYRCECYE